MPKIRRPPAVRASIRTPWPVGTRKPMPRAWSARNPTSIDRLRPLRRDRVPVATPPRRGSGELTGQVILLVQVEPSRGERFTRRPRTSATRFDRRARSMGGEGVRASVCGPPTRPDDGRARGGGRVRTAPATTFRGGSPELCAGSFGRPTGGRLGISRPGDGWRVGHCAPPDRGVFNRPENHEGLNLCALRRRVMNFRSP